VVIADLFPDLTVVTTKREEHRTPGGRIQPFTWLLMTTKAQKPRLAHSRHLPGGVPMYGRPA